MSRIMRAGAVGFLAGFGGVIVAAWLGAMYDDYRRAQAVCAVLDYEAARLRAFAAEHRNWATGEPLGRRGPSSVPERPL